MQTVLEILLDLPKFRLHTLPYRLSKYDKLSSHGSVTYVRKTKEIERLGLPFSTPLAILGGIPPKFNQTGFVGMQFQLELMKTIPHVLQELFGVFAILEADRKVIRKPHDDHVTVCMLPPPLVGPIDRTRSEGTRWQAKEIHSHPEVYRFRSSFFSHPRSLPR